MRPINLSLAGVVLLALTGCQSAPVTVSEPIKTFSISPECIEYTLQTDDEMIVGFRPVYFELNSDKSYSKLDAHMSCVATYLANHVDKELNIQGLTDDKGTIKYNKALAQRRADGIVEYLVSLGASYDQLVSSTKIIEDNGVRLTSSERSKTRRVDFIITDKSS
ncbi:OmpA family protein [Shewanella sp. SR43-4]|jgi:outer membrane protein OmpA-like peptidoglycan-associated protein|uniref:OmpA family protein n=2 Tax=Shewanella TaxID=22 RepID=A0ABV0FLS4_9GAMM|nr:MULTISPECIES: OmpA family protein [Shewanella]NCQ43565.1 OmpA family protein [Shewanella frigidimarina]MBB1316771.1 OmpA family protein [Shewanella sp. SR43-4]MBB1477233.1 OmpA family protein [Shewanella sp. SG41-3]NCO69939.1 OmpA family protein [Shewanella vesiculosa]NCP35479.1 OmpA family protein [Shewanella vesiculosa]|tara:strand:- start:403 stop:894 length:492 start_codon:yes stop_codon:yes gene_type:complete